MAKTLSQIQKQIVQLQKEAESLRAKEVGGVVSRIREAIDHYGLTAADLFGKGAAAKPGRKARAGAAGKPASKGAARPVGLVKYRDEAGHTWSGHGKRPNWYKDALAAGKTPDDLLAK